MADAPSPVFDETKRYEIQRALNEIARLQADDEMLPSKLFRLAATVCPTPKDFEEIQKYIIYDDQNDRREYYDKAFRTIFFEKIWAQMNKKLLIMDPLTQVAAMGAYPGDHTRAFDFNDLSPRFFTGPLRGSGIFGYISGPVQKPLGVGKTDFAGRMIEMHGSDGDLVCTNILIDDMPPYLKQVWGLKDMLRYSVMNLFHGKTTKAYLDEFTQYVSKEKATAGGWVNLKKLLYLCRKMGLDIIAISQRETEIPYAIQEMALWHCQKQDKSVMDLRRYSDITRVINVPGTTLHFQTGHPGSFSIDDLNIDEMHDYIVSVEKEAQNTGTTPNLLKTILEFIDMDASEITKQDYKTFAKVAYVRVGMTQKEIASYCLIDDRPVSQKTVSNWLDSMGVT
jgi:hypothetical protein